MILCAPLKPDSAYTWMLPVLLLVFTSLSHQTSSTCRQQGSLRAMKGFNHKIYHQPGDITIGGIVSVARPMESEDCHGELTALASGTLQFTEAVNFAVQSVNNDSSVLPNVTLGFVLITDCGSTNMALAKAVTFLPRVVLPEDSKCLLNGTHTLNIATLGNSHFAGDQEMPYYDVIGVLSPWTSDSTALVSRLYSSAKIPILGFTISSDELSNKKAYPYFLRVSSPDLYRFKAVLTFIQSYNWTYISIVYAYGSYGENGYENVKTMAHEHGICIATAHRVDSRTKFDAVVEEMNSYYQARVVLLLIYPTETKQIFASVKKLNLTGHFIFVNGHEFGTYLRTQYREFTSDVMDSFSFIYHNKYVPEFYQYIRSLNVNTSSNPWIRKLWEEIVHCSFNENTCQQDQDILQAKGFSFIKLTSSLIDGVKVYAQAAHNLLTDLCPGVSGAEARDCITGELLLKYLRNTSIVGSTGPIEFNENGDAAGNYEISQVRKGKRILPVNDIIPSSEGLEEEMIALYDITTEKITYEGQPISWKYFRQEKRFVPLPQGETSDIPESVCSRPCLPGEFKIQRELPCCWECWKCRDNEFVKYKDGCKACPEFTWPDPNSGFTSCKMIPLSYHTPSDTIPMIQIILAVIASICVLGVFAGYVYCRNTRVIKASSKELSFLQMAAVLVGYVTVVVFQFKPTSGTCGTLYFLFCLSFAWLYAPLIVKAVRVYRIFLSNVKHRRKPSFVSPHTQVIMAMILILIQVVLCLVVYIKYEPSAKKTQPVLTEQFVELSCDMTVPGLASFLTYNLVLIMISLVLAFKTRQLPHNFNESWFIFMCASTTLVIWLAFIPTYFTASKQNVRMMLLSLALFLNHTVALIFLFIPKIYAAIYVPSANLATTRSVGVTNITSFTQSLPLPRHNSRVHPVSGTAQGSSNG